MTSIKFHFRPSTCKGREKGTLFIRIIHRRVYRDIRREYAVYSDEWDAIRHTLRMPGTANPDRNRQLTEIHDAMHSDLTQLRSIVRTLSENGPYGVADIVNRFLDTDESEKLLGFTHQLSSKLHTEGRYRTARAYRSAAKSLVQFNGGRNLFMSDITSSLIRSYERYLLDRGLQMNTISFYMRNLRAIYYKAIAAKRIARHESNPFENVFTGVYETKRRSLDQPDMNRLAGLCNTLNRDDSKLRDALLYFMFAYHSRGMSFIDLAYLKKSDIKGNVLLYKRKKTGFYLEVKITPAMKKIIHYFRSQTKRSPYVFPIINPEAADHRLQYESALNRQNRFLKLLSTMSGINKNLSTHVARHTWATLAKRLGYNISLISEGLGHRDTKVTSIYLASFERSAMDEISTRLSKAIKAA